MPQAILASIGSAISESPLALLQAGSSFNLALSYSRGTLRSDYHRRWRS